MKRAGFLLLAALAAALGAAPRAGAAPTLGVRALYDRDAERQVESKIKAGVPFELMAVVTQDQKTVYRRVLHLQYDLWDEDVTIREGERLCQKVKLRDASDALCSCLEPAGRIAPAGSVGIFRLMVNPLWAGRIARLSGSSAAGATAASGGFQKVRINWKKVTEELAVEKMLIAREVKF